MNLSQAANELRSMAEKLESASFYLRHPDGQITVTKTAQCLRELFGPHGYFSIKCEIDFHADQDATAEWSIYTDPCPCTNNGQNKLWPKHATLAAALAEIQHAFATPDNAMAIDNTL
jgi:hypothetical protein